MSCFRATVVLYFNVVSGLVGIGLMRAWVRSESACISTSFDAIIGNVRVSGKKYVVLETISLSKLGM